MESIDKMLFSDVSEESERSISLGDAFDVKASIWLVVITFLAAQTAYFFTLDLNPLAEGLQTLSALSLVVATALVLRALYPEQYLVFTPSNGGIEKRIERVRAFYEKAENAEELVAGEIIKNKIGWAKERISTNKKFNDRKSRLVYRSFWCMATALVANLATLGCLSAHFFSKAH